MLDPELDRFQRRVSDSWHTTHTHTYSAPQQESRFWPCCDSCRVYQLNLHGNYPHLVHRVKVGLCMSQIMDWHHLSCGFSMSKMSNINVRLTTHTQCWVSNSHFSAWLMNQLKMLHGLVAKWAIPTTSHLETSIRVMLVYTLVVVLFKISWFLLQLVLSLIHIWRCRRSTLCRSRWSPYH